MFAIVVVLLVLECCVGGASRRMRMKEARSVDNDWSVVVCAGDEGLRVKGREEECRLEEESRIFKRGVGTSARGALALSRTFRKLAASTVRCAFLDWFGAAGETGSSPAIPGSQQGKTPLEPVAARRDVRIHCHAIDARS